MFNCKKCGACCEILPIITFGKPCEYYDSIHKLCKIYEDRPEICRSDKGTKEYNEFRIKFCDTLREFRRLQCGKQ